MPIKGLTTQREPAFPRIGVLRKGGVKSAKQPGRDLKYFRFDTESKDALKNFHDAYGKEPDTINVYLPYTTPEENFQAWQEEYRAGGLVHRCDGETMTVWLGPDGKYSTDPKPCPYHTGESRRTKEEPGCKAVGRLTVIIPELQRFAYVTAGTTSLNDIMELTDNLNAVFAMRGNLQGVPFVLCRRPKMISTPAPDGGRARYEKWMLSLEVNPQWATLQLETMRKQALLPAGVKLLTSGHAVEASTGEIVDGEWEDEEPDPTINSLNDVEELDPTPTEEFNAIPSVPAGGKSSDGAKASAPTNGKPADSGKMHAMVTQMGGGLDVDAFRHFLVAQWSEGEIQTTSELDADEVAAFCAWLDSAKRGRLDVKLPELREMFQSQAVPA